MGASVARHPHGKRDEVDLFIAWGGLEPSQSAFSIISCAQSFSLLETNCWIVIGLMPPLLKAWKQSDKNSKILGIMLRFLEAASFLDCLMVQCPIHA